MAQSATRQAFEHYFRTGRRLPLSVFSTDPAPIATKFNPYHDPQNGQFTSASVGAGGKRDARGIWGGGGFTGGGGGGGSAGGGGASGSWGKPSPAQHRSSTRRDQPNLQSGSVTIRAVKTTSATATIQDHVFGRNGYTYRFDAADRTTSVTGTLTLSPDPQRSRSAQAGAGGSDRLPTDDGGHYVAARFDGPTDTSNHFA